jgi:hypothetical protein
MQIKRGESKSGVNSENKDYKYAKQNNLKTGQTIE